MGCKGPVLVSSGSVSFMFSAQYQWRLRRTTMSYILGRRWKDITITFVFVSLLSKITPLLRSASTFYCCHPEIPIIEALPFLRLHYASYHLWRIRSKYTLYVYDSQLKSYMNLLLALVECSSKSKVIKMDFEKKNGQQIKKIDTVSQDALEGQLSNEMYCLVVYKLYKIAHYLRMHTFLYPEGLVRSSSINLKQGWEHDVKNVYQEMLLFRLTSMVLSAVLLLHEKDIVL